VEEGHPCAVVPLTPPSGQDCRYMILPDAVFTEIDTCLLIEYKGAPLAPLTLARPQLPALTHAY